ncbi:MAG: hypothetical protein ACI86H_002894, partial [bacterium]
MKAKDFEYGKISTIQVKPKSVSNFGNDYFQSKECVISKNDHTNAVTLRVSGKAWDVKGINKKQNSDLNILLDLDIPRVVWIVGATGKKPVREYTIQVHEFDPLRIKIPESMEIGIDEKIEDDLKQKYNKKNLEVGIKWLKQQFLLESITKNGLHRAFVSASQKSQDKSFRIYGTSITIDVELNEINKKYNIIRITKKTNNKQNQKISILEADIQFMDITQAGQAKMQTQMELNQIVRKADSYLKMWKEYNEIEERLTLKKAREFNRVPYSSRKEGSEEWIFELSNKNDLDFLNSYYLKENRNLTLECRTSNNLPDYLIDLDIESIFENSSKKRRDKHFSGKVSIIKNSIILKPYSEGMPKPPEQGILIFSLIGDQKKLERRKDAMEAIQSADAKIPYLGLILEQQPFPEVRQRKIKELSPSVRKEFPTANPRQRQALKYGLNTPEIFIIIGPPGTGKTQVLSVLCLRFIEEAQKNNIPISRMIGLSAFQHDAVENAAARVKVYGIPTMKHGKKKDQAEHREWINEWIQQKTEQLKDKQDEYPEIPLEQRLKKIKEQYIFYLKTETDKKTSACYLEDLLEWGGDELSGSLRDKIITKKHALQSSSFSFDNSDELELAIRAIRSIRTNTTAFSDDGNITVQKVIKRLNDIDWKGSEEESNLLQKASIIECEQVDESFLIELQGLQNQLLDYLIEQSRKTLLPESKDEEIIQLFLEVLKEIKHWQSTHSEAGVVATLVEDMTNDPQGLRKTLSEYQMVLAATTQGIAGKQIAQLKEYDTEFEVVIVDEAARANPLDLMIPLSKAKKKIILVGDHRQLPHMLEPTVEETLRQNVEESVKDAYQKSLFERLKIFLTEKEKEDNIKRVIMLNQQYRMHPFIGTFISHVFYERLGDEPILSDHLNENDFIHGLKDYQAQIEDGTEAKEKVIAWMDVPLSQYGENKKGAGNSKFRLSEAKKIAREVESILTENQKLTVGVISFY